MEKLKYFQDIIKEKRKQTSFRDYLKEIVSFRTMNMYNNSGFVSIYPPNIHRLWKIVSHREFDETRDSISKYWLEYDFSLNFFSNFQILFDSMKLAPTVIHWECENADYTDQTLNCKNCYLSFVIIIWCENVLYSFSVKENSINVLNSVVVRDTCENIFTSKWIIKSYNIFYSKHIINCSNLWFCSNMVWCNDCIFCGNLDNKSYCIKNIQFTKEDYKIEKEKILKNKKDFFDRFNKIDDKWNNFSSNDTNGIFNIQCENVVNWANNYQIKNAKNVMFIWWKWAGENIYDCFLNTPPETDVYGVFGTWYCDNIYNSYQLTWGSNLYYCAIMERCSYCLWCVWLKNKSYCILNKQYSKEEWEILADKIFSQMEVDWILWDFLPWTFNPFYFNDTAAYLIDDSFTKEEVEKDWYLWREEAIKVDIPENAEIIRTNPPVLSDIPLDKGVKTSETDFGGFLSDFQWFDENWNWLIDPEIMKKVIKDEKWNIYRIVKMEYDFLMKHWLPLPEVHWLDRIKMWFKF